MFDVSSFFVFALVFAVAAFAAFMARRGGAAAFAAFMARLRGGAAAFAAFMTFIAMAEALQSPPIEKTANVDPMREF